MIKKSKREIRDITKFLKKQDKQKMIPYMTKEIKNTKRQGELDQTSNKIQAINKMKKVA